MSSANGFASNGQLFYTSHPVTHQANPVDRWERLIDPDGLMGEGPTTNISTLSRLDFFRRLTDDRRDINAECYFPPSITAQMYRDLYERDAIAARVVEVMPKESWQVQPTVYETEDPDDATEFEQAWDELGKSLSHTKSYYQDEQGSPVWEYLLRADILSGIGQYGVIMLGLDDGLDPSWPVEGFEEWNSVPADSEEFTKFKQAGAGKVTPAKAKELQDADDETQTTRGFSGFSTQWTNSPNARNASEITINSVDAKGKKSQRIRNRAAHEFDPARDALRDESGQYRLTVNKAKPPAPGKPAKAGRRKLIYLRVFSEASAMVTRFETNRTSPRFGQPLQYLLTFNNRPNSDAGSNMGTGLPIASMNVHWTRCVHIADNLSESEVFGVPRMRPVFNNLLNLQKIYGASAEGYWQSCFNILFFQTNPQLGGNVVVGKDKIRDMMEQIRNGTQRHGILSGLTANPVAPQVIDPTPFIASQIEAVAIKLGMPVRILKGSERGELASSEDDGAWNDELRLRQQTHVTPRVIVPVVDRLILCGVLPEPTAKQDVEDESNADQNPSEGVGPPMKGAQPPAPPQAGKKPPPTANRWYAKVYYRTDYAVNADTGEPEPVTKEVGRSQVLKSDGGYSVEWPDLESQTALEKSQVASALATAVSTYAGPGNAPTVLPPHVFFTKILGWDEEEVDQILDDAAAYVEDQQNAAMEQQQAQIDAGLAPDPTQPPATPGSNPDDANPESNPFRTDAPPTGNAFCSTGKGGGVDPTCGHGNGTAAGGGSGDKSHESKLNLVRQKGNTHEGVPEAHAKTMVDHADIHKAMTWQNNMTVVVGGNKPNPGLPEGTRPKLSDLERGALQKYSFKNDGPLNQILRGTAEPTKDGTVLHTARSGERTTTPYRKEFYDEMHAQMQSAFAKAPVLKTPVKVVRGMNLSPGDLEKYVAGMDASMKSGKPIEMKGYTSTARPTGMMAKVGLTPGVGKPFRGNVSVAIHAVHGLDMMPHSQLPAEGEFLLPHGAKFSVKSIVKKSDGYHVELHQHPPDNRGGGTTNQELAAIREFTTQNVAVPDIAEDASCRPQNNPPHLTMNPSARRVNLAPMT